MTDHIHDKLFFPDYLQTSILLSKTHDSWVYFTPKVKVIIFFIFFSGLLRHHQHIARGQLTSINLFSAQSIVRVWICCSLS